RAQGPRFPRDPADEVVVMLQAQRRLPAYERPLHVGVDEYLLGRHGHVGPAGLLDELPAGGGVEVLTGFNAAAWRAPVLPLGRRVVVEEQQHPFRRIDRYHPSRQPHGQLRLIHETIVRHRAARELAIPWRACLNVSRSPVTWPRCARAAASRGSWRT